MWNKVGSLVPYANQGSESCNHYHKKIAEIMGRGQLVANENLEVCLYLIRQRLYEMPEHVKALESWILEKYQAWIISTNKK